MRFVLLPKESLVSASLARKQDYYIARRQRSVSKGKGDPRKRGPFDLMNALTSVFSSVFL